MGYADKDSIPSKPCSLISYLDMDVHFFIHITHVQTKSTIQIYQKKNKNPTNLKLVSVIISLKVFPSMYGCKIRPLPVPSSPSITGTTENYALIRRQRK